MCTAYQVTVAGFGQQELTRHFTAKGELRSHSAHGSNSRNTGLGLIKVTEQNCVGRKEINPNLRGKEPLTKDDKKYHVLSNFPKYNHARHIFHSYNLQYETLGNLCIVLCVCKLTRGKRYFRK